VDDLGEIPMGEEWEGGVGERTPGMGEGETSGELLRKKAFN